MTFIISRACSICFSRVNNERDKPRPTGIRSPDTPFKVTVKAEYSPPCSQGPAAGPYPEPVHAITSHSFKIHLNIILPLVPHPRGFVPSRIPTKTLQSSFLPFVLHVLPFSPSSIRPSYQPFHEMSFCNTVSYKSLSYRIRHQVSHPCTNGNIMFIHIWS